ncbi:MAG: response regulator [Thermoanaerobaculia bacterium]
MPARKRTPSRCPNPTSKRASPRRERSAGAPALALWPLSCFRSFRSTRPETEPLDFNEPAARRSTRILIVEDDADLRESLSQILEDEGFEVIGAENGRIALDYLKGNSAPCVVLLDLMMPVMNGWEFRDAQLQDPELSEIPVVVLSADARTSSKAQALGVEQYLRKPVQLDQLVGIVAGLCG